MEIKKLKRLDPEEKKKLLESVKPPHERIDLKKLDPEKRMKLLESAKLPEEVLKAVAGGNDEEEDICPNCGSNNIHYEWLDVYNFCLVTCYDCWKTWYC